MRVIRSALLGAAACALAVGTAFAADIVTEKNKTDISNATRSDDSGFAKLDKNRNGYISKAEAKADPALARDFKKFDLNHDGKLNRAEYLAASAKEDAGSAIDKMKGEGEAAKAPASSAGSSGSESK